MGGLLLFYPHYHPFTSIHIHSPHIWGWVLQGFWPFISPICLARHELLHPENHRGTLKSGWHLVCTRQNQLAYARGSLTRPCTRTFSCCPLHLAIVFWLYFLVLCKGDFRLRATSVILHWFIALKTSQLFHCTFIFLKIEPTGELGNCFLVGFTTLDMLCFGVINCPGGFLWLNSANSEARPHSKLWQLEGGGTTKRRGLRGQEKLERSWVAKAGFKHQKEIQQLVLPRTG
jgi:hypothetical protein